jgi:hypothetical protein
MEGLMKLRFVSVLAVLMCLAIATSVYAQAKKAADPITGTWTGDWGPSASDRNPVTVEFKLDGKTLTGNVLPPNGTPIPIQKGTFDSATGAIHMEADAMGRGNATIHYVVDGKLANNVLTGSWNHDNRKGDFKITKK